MKFLTGTVIVLCSLSSAAVLAAGETNHNVDGLNQSQSGA